MISCEIIFYLILLRRVDVKKNILKSNSKVKLFFVAEANMVSPLLNEIVPRSNKVLRFLFFEQQKDYRYNKNQHQRHIQQDVFQQSDFILYECMPFEEC